MKMSNYVFIALKAIPGCQYCVRLKAHWERIVAKIREKFPDLQVTDICKSNLRTEARNTQLLPIVERCGLYLPMFMLVKKDVWKEAVKNNTPLTPDTAGVTIMNLNVASKTYEAKHDIYTEGDYVTWIGGVVGVRAPSFIRPSNGPAPSTEPPIDNLQSQACSMNIVSYRHN